MGHLNLRGMSDNKLQARAQRLPKLQATTTAPCGLLAAPVGVTGSAMMRFKQWCCTQCGACSSMVLKFRRYGSLSFQKFRCTAPMCLRKISSWRRGSPPVQRFCRRSNKGDQKLLGFVLVWYLFLLDRYIPPCKAL